jgi:hypothetical protein
MIVIIPRVESHERYDISWTCQECGKTETIRSFSDLGWSWELAMEQLAGRKTFPYGGAWYLGRLYCKDHIHVQRNEARESEGW